MYVIAASPLAKIFQPAYHPLLKKTPELIFDENFEFNIMIERAAMRFEIPYKKPYMISTLKRNDVDYEWLFEWLTGGENGMRFARETAAYGIVKFSGEMQHNLMAEISAMIAIDQNSEKGKSRRKELQEKLIPDVRKVMTSYRKLADEKVMHAIRSVDRNLEDEYKRLQDDGKQPYNPSDVERLCAYVMANPKKLQSETEEQLDTQFKEWRKAISHVG